MRALYPKNTSAPSTLQSSVLSPPPSPLYRNAWSPVNYLLKRFWSSSIYNPSPFPEVFTSLTAPKHALWSSSTTLIVPCIFISFFQTTLECWSPGSCLLLFIFQPHSLPASLVPGTTLGIEKSHTFHLSLCIITADSNFIISIPTQYTHLFPKLFFFWLPIGQLHLGVSQLPQIKNVQNWTHHPLFNSLFYNKRCAYLSFIFPISNSPILHPKYFSNVFPQL